MSYSVRNIPRRRLIRFMSPAFYAEWLSDLLFQPSWQRKYRTFRK